MANDDYYGPAGIFSYGDSRRDRLQIEADEYDDRDNYLEEDEYDPDDRHEEPERDYKMNVVFWCRSDWYLWETIWKSDEITETQMAQQQHDEECGCDQAITCSSSGF